MAGVVLQFIALAHGEVIIVQPIMASSLLLAIVIERKDKGTSLAIGEWFSAIVLLIAMGGFILARGPSGAEVISSLPSMVISSVVLVTCTALVLLRSKFRRVLGATLLSGVTALGFANVSVLEREIGIELHQGIAQVFLSWQIWILIPLGLVSLVFAQSAFQSGDLKKTLPVMAAGEPVVAIILASVMTGERIIGGGGALDLISFSCLFIMLISLVVLSTVEAKKV